MDLKIIGGVGYQEVEELIRNREIKPIIETRGRFFHKKRFDLYTSPNQKYVLAFEYLGELRIASHYYNLIIETKERKIVKDFGERLFFCDYYRYGSPWVDGNRFILLEIEEKPNNQCIEHLILCDVNKNSEIIIASEMIVTFSSRFKGSKYILFVTMDKNKVHETKILNLVTNEIIILTTWLYPQDYTVLFDKEAKHIITINQDKKSELKILSFPAFNLLFSREIDMNIILSSVQRVIPKIKGPSPELKKYEEKHPVQNIVQESQWYAVEFDEQHNILFLGKKYKTYWANEKYYQDIEWVKTIIEI